MKKKYDLEVSAKIKISLCEVELTKEQFDKLYSVKWNNIEMHEPEFSILEEVGVDFTDACDMEDICLDDIHPTNPNNKF